MGITSFFKKLFNKKDLLRKKDERSILEKNFVRLKNDLIAEADNKKILIIGQPGAGKSSLLLHLTDNQCYPLPNISQKTNATDWSISSDVKLFYISNNFLIVDSPGYNTFTHRVSSFIEYFPFSSFDHIFFLIRSKIHNADLEMIKKLKNDIEKISLVRCFSESLTYQERIDIKDDFRKKLSYKNEIYFISNRNKEGLEDLKNLLLR